MPAFFMLCAILPYHNASQNLATEEILLRESADDYFLLYTNNPCVVVGKHQNALREVNFPFLFKSGIPVFRRITGGGTVFHDLGNVNFSFILNTNGKNQVDFERYSKPVLDYLISLGLNVRFGLRHEILCDELKISGNAEHIFKNRVLHHGTLLFDTDLNTLRLSIAREPERFSDKAVNSVPSTVMNMATKISPVLTVNNFMNGLLRFAQAYFENSSLFEPDENFENRVAALCETRYHTWEWNMAYHASYRMLVGTENRRDFYLFVEDGNIISLEKIDMPESDFSLFSSVLIGKKHRVEDLVQIFSGNDRAIPGNGTLTDKIVNYFF